MANPAEAFPQSNVDSRESEESGLTEEEIKEALCRFVRDHCCYGSAPLANIAITSISTNSAYHYHLESFTEKRRTENQEVPHYGDQIDGPENGPAWNIWDVEIPYKKGLFRNEKSEAVVPHTDQVITCPKCTGSGLGSCPTCLGSGSITKRQTRSRAREDGTWERYTVMGSDTCTGCSGNGQVRCLHCSGAGRLKTFLVVLAEAKNFISSKIIGPDNCSVPHKKLIKYGQGEISFHDQGITVAPLKNFHDQRVCKISQQLLVEFGESHPDEIILQQRHTVTVIPITEVKCTYKEKASSFWIYGLNKKVYFPDYFARCWCFSGCSIL